MPGNFRCWLRPPLSDRAPETVVPPNRENETSALGLSAKRHQMVSASKASWRTLLKDPGIFEEIRCPKFPFIQLYQHVECWRCRQSRANPSPPEFPVKQGKNREFLRIQPRFADSYVLNG